MIISLVDELYFLFSMEIFTTFLKEAYEKVLEEEIEEVSIVN